MSTTISWTETLQLDNPIFVDMRAPTEFAQGAIPGAINVPLLEDAERSEVGLIYRIKGPEQAKQLGLAMVSGKLPAFVDRIRELGATGRPVIVYCWRGGMRSKSMVIVLELMGVNARQLIGGYKAFRSYLLDALDKFTVEPPVVVLCGSTGTGKTSLLSMLTERGLPAIDLEQLANHRGSAFGQIGLGPSRSMQNFEALLFAQLQRLNAAPYIVVECESRRIGNVFIPDALFGAMKKGRRILLQAGLEIRVDRLIDEYLDVYRQRRDDIAASISSLKHRLGQAKTNKLLNDLAADRFRDVVRVLLTDYYDPLYGYERANPADYDWVVNADNLADAFTRIVEYLNRLRR